MTKTLTLIGLLAIHFALQVYGAFGSPGIESAGPLGSCLQRYARITGSGSEFGFFAPRPGSPMRARVFVERDGSWSELVPHELASGEAKERHRAMVGVLRNEDSGGRATVLGQSFAAWAFDKAAGHDRAIIRFEALIIPVLGAGDPFWITRHELTFERKE